MFCGLVKRTVIGTSLILAGMFSINTGSPAFAQDAVDTDATKVLSTMAGYLGGLQMFTAKFDAYFDVVSPQGQKLKFVSSGNLAVKRPGHLRVSRTGAIANVDFVLDGKMLTVHGKKLNGFVQFPAKTIDEAILAIRDQIGFPVPGADLIAASPLNKDVTDIVSGTHIGMTQIRGEAVHHLAFRGAQVDWQIWIKDGDQPLPVKYVITNKWMTGAPDYSLEISDWNVSPELAETTFTFTPPAGAKKLSAMVLDEVGQIISSGE